jgi:nucleotide-binding universal stress UspA family protein
MSDSAEPRSIVVGIDGSKAAIRAALWAVDEAAGRGITLRLLGAVEPGDTPAAAESAVRHAATARRDAGTPVKIETRVTAGPAARSLVRASASAALVCVGAVGLRHFQPGRVGSTAAAVATSAHCPVAIIRGHKGHEEHPGQPTGRAGAIVVELDGSVENEVLLGAAIEQARLRDAAVHAIICRRTGDKGAEEDEGDRRALADLDRRLDRWRRRYPDIQVESAVTHGGLLDYVARHRPARLAIVGSRNRQHLDEIVGPVGSAILQDADCSLLVVNRQHL